jgi:Spy/CpxP family protein refolding chaperone
MFRSLLALLALSFALPLAASAQTTPQMPPQDAPPGAGAPAAPGATPHRHHHNRYMSALHSLALSPDQQQQIRGFMRDTRAANQGADPQTKHANVKKMRSEIDGILTPDQRTQLRAALVQQRTNPPTQ